MYQIKYIAVQKERDQAENACVIKRKVCQPSRLLQNLGGREGEGEKNTRRTWGRSGRKERQRNDVKSSRPNEIPRQL